MKKYLFVSVILLIIFSSCAAQKTETTNPPQRQNRQANRQGKLTPAERQAKLEQRQQRQQQRQNGTGANNPNHTQRQNRNGANPNRNNTNNRNNQGEVAQARAGYALPPTTTTRGDKEDSKGNLNVAAFGLAGNGTTNDYTAFKALTDYATLHSPTIRTITLGKNKNYFISSKSTTGTNGFDPTDLGFYALNNCVIDGNGATITFDGNFLKDERKERMVKMLFQNCKKITIKNLTVDGQNNVTQTPAKVGAGNWHCFGIRACDDVKILNCTAKHGTVDGFNFTSDIRGTVQQVCHNVYMKDCVSEYNGRQGISIIQCVNFLAENCIFRFTGQGGGKAFNPSAGCDVEPNFGSEEQGTIRVTDKTHNITFKHCSFIANKGGQFVCGGNPTRYYGIHVDSCILSDYDAASGFSATNKFCISLKGGVLFENNVVNANGFISLASFTKKANLDNSEVIIRNNKFTFNKGGSWLESATGMKKVLIENNQFIGSKTANTNAKINPANALIDLEPNGNAVWKNNYVYVPKEYFSGSDAKKVAQFDGWNIENPDFDTDMLSSAAATKAELKVSAVNSNVTNTSSIIKKSKNPNAIKLEQSSRQK